MKLHAIFTRTGAQALTLLALAAVVLAATPIVWAQAVPDDVVVGPRPCLYLEEGVWASDVAGSSQGKQNNGTDITDPERTNPAAATGAADWNNGDDTGFFSLGFGGIVTLEFDQYVLNVAGDDLVVYEATNGDTYPLEEVEVEVSQNGSDWEQIDNADNTDTTDRDTSLDIDGSGFEWIKFVRFTDVTDGALHDETADAFDLDAVFAVSADCEEPGDEPTDVRGVITIAKVFGAENDWSFDFTGTDDLAFALTDEEPSETFVLDAGVYTFAEVLSSEDGTDLLDITCTQGADIVPDLALGTVAITLEAEEDVTCTFTNRPTPDNGGGDPQDEPFTCSLEASDENVEEEEEFTLTWETVNADSVSIDSGIGAVAANGSIETAIEDDTTFTLTATRVNGEDETEETVNCSVEVEIESSGGGGTRTDRPRGGGGSSTGDEPEEDEDVPEGQVLGEQVSVAPLGAAATGAGGAAPVATYAYFGIALFGRTRTVVRNG